MNPFNLFRSPRRITPLVLPLPLVFLFWVSCAFISPIETPDSQRKAASVSIDIERGENFLAKKEYKRAIVEFRNALQADPSNERAKTDLGIAQKRLRAQRDATLHTLVRLGDAGSKMYDDKEYVKAGRSWKEAIDLYHAHPDPELQKELPFKIEEMEVRLDEIIRSLLDKGVLLYRNGELRGAISAWQDVLSIDPQQKDALDYINKAQTKIETLEDLSASQ